MESRRQQQIAKLVQQATSEVFQHQGFDFYGRAFVTISGVHITPDLLVAKVYLSVYNVEDKAETLSQIKGNASTIRGKVGSKLRKKIRYIPEMQFYLDDSLDSVFELENLFSKIKEEE